MGNRGGSAGYVLARSVLYDLLLRQIPANKIHLKKRVLSVSQGDVSVRIECQDNTFYEGDILVGADGAYSSVRQSLYDRMKRDNLLPRADQGVLPYSCVCLVGQTDPLDPEVFPELKEPISTFWAIKADDKPYSVSWVWKEMNQKKALCLAAVDVHASLCPSHHLFLLCLVDKYISARQPVLLARYSISGRGFQQRE